jgi:hypothetical protein
VLFSRSGWFVNRFPIDNESAVPNHQSSMNLAIPNPPMRQLPETGFCAVTQKLGPQARRLLSNLESASHETVSLLLRGSAPFTADQLETLRRDGAQIRTTAGDVVSADVPLTAVRAVTDHEFVVNAELSQPLFYEKPTAPFSDAE